MVMMPGVPHVPAVQTPAPPAQNEAGDHGPFLAPRAAGGWIAVDLDGTLAHYDRWHEDMRVGEPIMPMVERVRAWIAAGRSVVIFTARVSRADLNPERSRQVDECRAIIDAWCMVQFGQRLRVTAEKDYRIVEFWDDRAVAVETNTGRVLGPISTVTPDGM